MPKANSDTNITSTTGMIPARTADKSPVALMTMVCAVLVDRGAAKARAGVSSARVAAPVRERPTATLFASFRIVLKLATRNVLADVTDTHAKGQERHEHYQYHGDDTSKHRAQIIRSVHYDCLCRAC